RVLVYQKVGQQIQGMLGAYRHDDLVCVSPDASTRKHLGADLLDQSRIVMGNQVGSPAADIQDRQRLEAAFAPFRGWEKLLIKLTVDKRIIDLLPVARLGDVALQGRTQPQPLFPLGL